MTITNDRHWTALERTCLSLYGGMAIPFLYFVALIVLLGIFRSRLSERSMEWLAFPLAWPVTVIESFYHPRIEAVGDVFGAGFTELAATFAINFLTYSLVTYFALLILAKIKWRIRTPDDQSRQLSS